MYNMNIFQVRDYIQSEMQSYYDLFTGHISIIHEALNIVPHVSLNCFVSIMIITLYQPLVFCPLNHLYYLHSYHCIWYI